MSDGDVPDVFRLLCHDIEWTTIVAHSANEGRPCPWSDINAMEMLQSCTKPLSLHQ